MKLNIRPITDEQVTEFFLSDPALCFLGVSDYGLAELYEHKKYTRPPGTTVLGVGIGDDIALIINYTWFTEICINVHIYLHSQYHHTDMFSVLQQELKKYFLENTQVKKVISMSPSTCPHIHGACEKFGFVREGEIKNSMLWRQEIVDTVIYGLNLRNI